MACRSVRDKRELVRLVRVSEGLVEVDDTGRKAGRGAYLCRRTECWDTGIKKGRLEYNLKTTLSPENREKLMEFGRSFAEAGNDVK